MSWTKAEHQIIGGIEKNVTDLVNIIKGDYEPGKPGMAEDLRNVQQDTVTIRHDLKASNRKHDRTHKLQWRMLTGVGLVAGLGLMLHLTVAGDMIMGLLEVVIKWVT